MEKNDEYFMRLALELAREAAQSGEIPVGAVVICGEEVIGRGKNRRETNKSASAHAEMLAIEEACKNKGDWRLDDSRIYVTLEPCPMCAGAILNARLRRVIYGAKDEKYGCLGGMMNLYEFPFWTRPSISAGVLEAECTAVIRDFMEKLR